MILSIFKLIIASSFSVIAAAFFYKLENKPGFVKLNYYIRQVIIGVVFGLIAISGTEWGIPARGVLINSRDSAPIVAGLVFGGPAGIIAGIIGGVERWLAVYWGAGSFTRVACSVSTILAGVYAAFLRKFLFEGKKPTWGMALGSGIIMEVFHLSMVFITNVKDATKAISVVEVCFGPMVAAVGLSVMLSVVVVSLLSGERSIKIKRAKGDGKHNTTPIFETIQKWLLIVLVLAFSVTIYFTYRLQNNMSLNEANSYINAAIDDVAADIADAADDHMIEIAGMIHKEIKSGKKDLDFMALKYEVTEICLVNKDGIIEDSNINSYIGFDMASGEQSAEFLCLLDGKTKAYAQAYGPTAADSTIFRKYAGIATDYGFLQISYDADHFQKEVDSQINNVAVNRHIGTNGGVIILDKDFRVVSISKSLGLNIKSVEKPDDDVDVPLDGSILREKIADKEYYIGIRNVEGYLIAGIYPVDEALMSRDIAMYVAFFSMLIVFSVMFAVIYMLIKRVVVNQIIKMTESLSVIANGDLNEVVDVRSNKEFASLSDDINSTVDTLKRYIGEAAARIDKELEFAKAIQISALPNIFPDKEKYGVYARMDTAKTVGGDFYDFYNTDENTLNFLIADVSGKGIPAAMFMMRAKSVLKSMTEQGYEVNEVFVRGNDSLCSGNDAGMFVTAWQGMVNLETGLLRFANAGHNLPALKHKDGKFEFCKQKVNLVLGGMEGLPYSINEIQLEPGDIMYLYTDGVTEATNAANELYGDDRLLDALNRREFSSLKDMCDYIKEDIDAFVKEADQFDDITMVAFEYKG